SAKGDDKFITTDYLQQCPLRPSYGRCPTGHSLFRCLSGPDAQFRTGAALEVLTFGTGRY
ncbi:hypothetical protein, partial [Citrobacter youngae]|uniref:hypothetical protein n=1 Tax=Citrobacter youngae TaxID=133448 RepID=UPI0039B5E587